MMQKKSQVWDIENKLENEKIRKYLMNDLKYLILSEYYKKISLDKNIRKIDGKILLTSTAIMAVVQP